MRQLRKAGVCQDDLLYYYQAVVRPVLEYASPCWQTSLTKEQTKQLGDYYYYYYFFIPQVVKIPGVKNYKS